MSCFSIDFQWLPREYGDAIARATLAEVTITADGSTVTELDDLMARTVRRGVRVSAYALAKWFASNWWRLRWEPERNTLSWKMSHKIGAAGEGYLWPDLAFISDGGMVLVHAKSSPPSSEAPLRYLSNIDVVISAGEFEHGIDTFIEAVIGRLSGAGINEDGLFAVWREILEERRDPKLTAWRKIEAVLGFDPGDAPDQLIADIQKAGREYGAGAVEEMAAASGENALDDINVLWDGPRREALALNVPDIDSLRRKIHDEIQSFPFPWQKAVEAARMVRDAWSLDAGPVSTAKLSEIFGISQDMIERPSSIKGPMNAGFRNGQMDCFSVFLKSPISVSRRFALLRLVGDHLTATPEDRLLPAAPRVGTQRQKFQRAFAQEFLCPYSELVSYLDSEEPSNEAIEDAANHFAVSPLMVSTILVNKGDLERSYLACSQ